MIQASRRSQNFNYAIRNIVQAAEALEKQGRAVIYLNIGDPQMYGFRPPAHLVEAVAAALADGFTGYAHSAGILPAREAVAAYATALGAPTRPDEVVITSGASEGAELTLTALLNEGDEVLLPSPGYPLYLAIVEKLGGRIVYYHVDETTDWQPSVEEVASLITPRTRAILLINPNNPTGRITADKTTAQLLELADRHGLLVISDEVYRDLCFVEPPVSASRLAQEIGVPLITLESLSKTHLVPGWRVGWLRYTNIERMRELAAAIMKLAGGRLCSPTPTQYAVKPALEGDRSFQQEFMRQIRSRRDFAVSQIATMEGLSCAEPEAAFYLLIKAHELGGRSDEQFVLDLLNETGVLAVHGSGFGAEARHGYFRIVYLADEATLGLAMDGLRRFAARSLASV